MTGESWGLIGGILGAILGVGGGLIGTYFSISRCRSPDERKFMIQTAVIGWLFMILFFVLLVMLPNPYRFLVWLPYGALLAWGIPYTNRRLKRIQDAQHQPHNRH
jgi:uncharacterized membrane protein YfcA